MRYAVLSQELMDPGYRRGVAQNWRILSSASASASSSDSPQTSESLNPPDSPAVLPQEQNSNNGHPIHLVCQTMKRQIISRAFYGWLAYCRHLSTVRYVFEALLLEIFRYRYLLVISDECKNSKRSKNA